MGSHSCMIHSDFKYTKCGLMDDIHAKKQEDIFSFTIHIKESFMSVVIKLLSNWIFSSFSIDIP